MIVAGELWEGRLKGRRSDDLRALNDSLAIDHRLFREDIAGSRAHVSMLSKVGLISEAEHDIIASGLAQVEDEMASGAFEPLASDEDIHTAVERRLTEIVGPVGGKVHTGRSRNDQVALDVRLWIRSEILERIVPAILGFQSTLIRRAQEHLDDFLPGYTHLQQAQPVSLAHHLMAHFWALGRDVDRLISTADRLDISPLGAGALAGTSLPIDPATTAELLGFSQAFENSIDAVSDRDHVAEVLFDLSLLGIHLSRIGEELILWATTEFGYLTLDDSFATGSSMLPQKKNPDIAELARGKAGRLLGNLVTVLTALKGLPLAYNKDLQEDKEPLFDSCDTIVLTLAALDGMISTARFNTDVMSERASSPHLVATDLAEHLVKTGTPFRTAHGLVAELVAKSIAEDRSLEELVAAHEDLGAEALRLFEPGSSASSRTSHGGGGPAAVSDQLERASRLIAVDRARLGDRLARIPRDH